MRRFLVLGGSSPRRQVSDLRFYEASGSDRTDGFGSIGSEPAGSGSARAPARASLAFEMSNGSDSESEVSFDLGADLETSTASCTADTEDKVELRASKSGGSSASSATENSRVDRAVEQPSGEQYTTRRIKEEKRLRAEFDRHRERTLLTMPSGKVECDICKKKPSVLRCFDCRRDGCSLCEECHGQRHDEHSAFAHVVEWKDESTGGYSRGAQDGCEYFCKPICRECGRWYQDGQQAETKMEKTLSTLHNGNVHIIVVAWECPGCSAIVGADAADYRCFAGNNDRWFEEKLLQVLDDFDLACEFNTTNNNFRKFCDIRATRANSPAAAPTKDCLANAMRLYRAMRNEMATGELGYEGQEEGRVDLLRCPCCKEGRRPLRMNYDGCFKLKQLATAESAYGPPLSKTTPFGEISYTEEDKSVEVAEFQKFVRWYDARLDETNSKRRRRRRTKGRGGWAGDANSNCGRIRAMEEQVRCSLSLHDPLIIPS